MGRPEDPVVDRSSLLGLSAPRHRGRPLAAAAAARPGRSSSELGTGWYLRGDVGWVDYSDPGKMPSAPGCPSTASA